MNRRLLSAVVALLILLTLFISDACAGKLREREAVIARQLDAYAKCAARNQGLDWVDICFTSETKMSGEVTQKAPSVAEDTLSEESEKGISGQDAYQEDEPRPENGYQKGDTTTKESQPGEFIDIGYVQVASKAFPSTDAAADITYKEISSTEYEDYDRYQLHEDYASEMNQNSFLWAFSRENDLTKLEIGPEIYYYDYREPGIMKDQGMMYGIHGSYTYRTSANQHVRSIKDVFSDTNKINVFKTDVRLAFGDVDYESNGTGTIDGIEYFTFEARGLFGYDLPIQSRSRVTPYLGLGWRYLKDDSGGLTSSTGHWGYDRESEYFYVPMGIEANTRLQNDWDLTLTLEYDYFVSGNQTSHLEDVGTSVCSASTMECYALDPLENDQKDGYGLRGSMKVIKKSEKIDFTFEPFIRYWKIDKSEDKQLSSLGGEIVWFGDEELTQPVLGYEPDNETLEYGVKLGLRY